MPLQTEYPFSLPKGYVDPDGNLHRDGVMRLSTAADEILPMKDVRVHQNPAYQSVILLSRVVSRLGEIDAVTPKVIESMFSSDFSFLQQLYHEINGDGSVDVDTECPACRHEFSVEVGAAGESSATPSTGSARR